MEKNRRPAKIRRENDMFDRVLLWFGVSLVFELFLLALNRYYFHYRASEIMFANHLDKIVLPALTFIGLAGIVASVAWAVFGRKNRSRLLPVTAAVFSVAVSAACFLSRTYGPVSVQVLQTAVPVAAVLVLVFYLYQKEFFVISVLSGLCVFGLWLYRRAGAGHPLLGYGYLAAFLILTAGAAWLTSMLQRADGVLALGERKLPLLQRGASYPMLYLTCALNALAAAAALALGTATAYGAIFVVLAWVFVMAVYYTVRLM